MISKSGSVVSPDVRVGVCQSIIVFAQTLGGRWLERNLRHFLTHVLADLLSHPKPTSTHTDAVFARRCVGHVIRALVVRLLGEKAQLSACKELVRPERHFHRVARWFIFRPNIVISAHF
jgi:hypothetical protein